MANHFKVKLINLSLTFPNDDSCIRVKDIKISEQSIPILVNQRFKNWVPDELMNEIGSANLYMENFSLFADCYFDRGIMIVQPKHDHIIVRTLKGNLLPFNSMSLHIDHIGYNEPEPYTVPRIINSKIISIAPVPYGADPAFCEPYIYMEQSSGLKQNHPERFRQADQALIFPGPLVNNFILD